MSLDVYLTGKTTTVKCVCSKCDNEHGAEIAPRLYQANITHNLGDMASAAGIYECLWYPEENGIEKAAQLIEPLRAGLALLKSDPRRFEKANSPNGWGLYANFVPFVEKYLAACDEHPEASVGVSR